MTISLETQKKDISMMTPDQRLELMECKFRRIQRALIGMMVAVTAIILVAAAPKPAEEVLQTKTLEVVDADGNVRIRLGPADEGYGLVVYDKDGTFQATLTDHPLGAAMSLSKGAGGITLMAQKGGCGMSMSDENGQPRALVVHQEGVPAIMLKDKEGNTVFSAPK